MTLRALFVTVLTYSCQTCLLIQQSDEQELGESFKLRSVIRKETIEKAN